VAFEPTTATIIAEGATSDAVEKAAAAKQCADPIVIRVPQQAPEDGEWTSGQEPPHGLILNAWLKGNVVPFLGAGASLVAESAIAISPESRHISCRKAIAQTSGPG
jgi:hypothetical protein